MLLSIVGEKMQRKTYIYIYIRCEYIHHLYAILFYHFSYQVNYIFFSDVKTTSQARRGPGFLHQSDLPDDEDEAGSVGSVEKLALLELKTFQADIRCKQIFVSTCFNPHVSLPNCWLFMMSFIPAGRMHRGRAFHLCRGDERGPAEGGDGTAMFQQSRQNRWQ